MENATSQISPHLPCPHSTCGANTWVPGSEHPWRIRRDVNPKREVSCRTLRNKTSRSRYNTNRTASEIRIPYPRFDGPFDVRKGEEQCESALETKRQVDTSDHVKRYVGSTPTIFPSRPLAPEPGVELLPHRQEATRYEEDTSPSDGGYLSPGNESNEGIHHIGILFIQIALRFQPLVPMGCEL